MDFVFLRCVGRATLHHAPRALALSAPFGEAVCNIADDALAVWKAVRRSASDRRAELEELVRADAAAVREQAEQVAGEVKPGDLRAALTRYLEHLPGLIRRSLARAEDPSGLTAPPGLLLENPEDLIPFLPLRPPRFSPGDRPAGVNSLVLEELLGLGGFGEVWKARDPSRPGTLAVALKFCLDPGAARAARLLGHEAALNRIMSQGRHPGIVALQQTYLESDPPCLEYEYVEGGDLARLIRAWAAVPPADLAERSIGLMHELADILAFAHGLEPPVVHRDLKPSNILLQPTATGTALRVTDFGIGGIAAQQAVNLRMSVRAALTTGLRGAHTPHYAPPEQKRGAPADPRDDVYALGVIWYQLLSGHLNREPGAGCRITLEKRKVPEPVISLVLHCLKRAHQRLADAGVLTRELVKLLPRPRRLTNSLGMELVLIPAGSFKMGSPKEEKEYIRKTFGAAAGDWADQEEQHDVEITRPFYMGAYEVTQEQYERIMGKNPARFHKDNGGGPTHPVEKVSWEDAVEFCKRLSAMEEEKRAGRMYRLPTEAEWEYACRGGAEQYAVFHFGNALTSTLANFNGNHPYGGASKGPYLGQTTPVGSYPPNTFGLYDMHGNVWEWCQDWYDKDHYKNSPIVVRPEARVLRGGSWAFYGWNCRSANRGKLAPDDRVVNVGFRVVCAAARIP